MTRKNSLSSRSDAGRFVIVAAAIAGPLLAACSAAPPDESTANAGAAVRHCPVDGCTDPPPPPPPRKISTWNPLSGSSCGNTPAEDWSTASVTPVPSNAPDSVSYVEIQLMKLGCSTPVYWRDGFGSQYAFSRAQLCQFTQEIDDYVASMAGPDPVNNPTLYYDADGVRSEHGPHTSWGFCDASIPSPPPGYYWVIPWSCPQGCPSTDACMVTAM